MYQSQFSRLIVLGFLALPSAGMPVLVSAAHAATGEPHCQSSQQRSADPSAQQFGDATSVIQDGTRGTRPPEGERSADSVLSSGTPAHADSVVISGAPAHADSATDSDSVVDSYRGATDSDNAADSYRGTTDSDSVADSYRGTADSDNVADSYLGATDSDSVADNALAPRNRAGARIARWLTAAGFVDVRQLDSSIKVALRHASADNVLGERVYHGVSECWLQREAARKLARASTLLRASRPDLRLSLAECLRPRDVQRRLWALVEGTAKRPYVANPNTGSMHNYGVAVDITLSDDRGIELDMGTPMHFFGALAEPRQEPRFVKMRQLTALHLHNRTLLRRVMQQAGFRGISNEWWHFFAVAPKTARIRYTPVETFAAPDDSPATEAAGGPVTEAAGS